MKWVLLSVTAAALSFSVMAAAQSSPPAEDVRAIEDLAARYLETLGGCDAAGFADLFVPETGYFASGFRGQMVGRDALIGLVESERHCEQPNASQTQNRTTPAVEIEVTADGVHGVVELGPQIGRYEDEYSKTPAGWRFASRTVITRAELDAGLSAHDLAAINALGGPHPGANYVERNGRRLLMSVGVAVAVQDGKITGRAYQADGSHFADVYEKTAEGRWRIVSRTHVPTETAQNRQAAAVSPGLVTGTGTFTSFVEDMDRSLSFYRDALGMEVPPLPEAGTRPYNPTNVQLYAMMDIQGARERHQAATVPDTNVRLEMMEIQDVAHKTIPLRIQDPGVVTPVLIVRDIDALLARVKQAQGEVATPGGKPVAFADGTRAVLIRDIDGRFIELRQPPAASLPAAAGSHLIVEERLSMAVRDLEEALRVYRDVLGFAVEMTEVDPALSELTGLAQLDARRAIARGPGNSLILEFVDYRGVDRKINEMNIQDRGAARLQIRTDNFDELLRRITAAGLPIRSEGGVPTPLPPNFMAAMVADPNNFFWTLIASCDGCAPTIQSSRR